MCQEKEIANPSPVFAEVFTGSSPASDKVSVREFWTVKRRNFVALRERRCRDSLKKAYVNLRDTMHVPSGTRLTRLDTLRLAILYIAHLAELLAKDDERHIKRIRLALEKVEMDYRITQDITPIPNDLAVSEAEWSKGLEFFWLQELMKSIAKENDAHS